MLKFVFYIRHLLNSYFSLKIDGLKKLHHRLAERAHQRESDLADVLDKVTGFQKGVDQTKADIDNLLDALSEDRPVGGEVKVIQQQQDEFKVSEKSWMHVVSFSAEKRGRPRSHLHEYCQWKFLYFFRNGKQISWGKPLFVTCFFLYWFMKMFCKLFLSSTAIL